MLSGRVLWLLITVASLLKAAGSGRAAPRARRLRARAGSEGSAGSGAKLRGRAGSNRRSAWAQLLRLWALATPAPSSFGARAYAALWQVRSSQIRDQTHVSCNGRRILYHSHQGSPLQLSLGPAKMGVPWAWGPPVALRHAGTAPCLTYVSFFRSRNLGKTESWFLPGPRALQDLLSSLTKIEPGSCSESLNPITRLTRSSFPF